MAYFPVFINLEDKKVLIVGGGNIAERKIDILFKFTSKIKVITKEIKSEKIKELYKNGKLDLEVRDFKVDDLENIDMVVVATDNLDIQRLIYNEAVKRKIFVNSVDALDYCNFIFPAILKEDDLVIAVSTSGKAPALASELKNLIKECLPKNLKYLLNEVSKLRESLPKGRERQKILVNFIKKSLKDRL